MKIRHRMSFAAYSDQAVDTMMDTAVGKPFRDTDGSVIGKIVEVSRTEDPKVLEFVSEVYMEEVDHIEDDSSTVVSIDSERKE